MRSQPLDRVRGLGGLQETVLADLEARAVLTPADRAALFRAPHRGSVEDRFSVYRDGYLARLAEALENDYPALRRLLGEGSFRSLARRYVRACPPVSFDLGRAGDRLPRFLTSDPLTGDFPFLPDLARLEWALSEAIVAPDATVLAWSDLVRLGPEASADLPLRPRPGTRLVRSRWPIADLRACRNAPEGSIDVQIEGRPMAVLVHRRGLDLVYRSVDEEEARFIEAAERGATLGVFQDSCAAGADPARTGRLLELFRRLVDEGLFLNPGVPGNPIPA